jgi:hypothetical protein
MAALRSLGLVAVVAFGLAPTVLAHGNHGHLPEGTFVSDDPIVRFPIPQWNRRLTDD